MAVSYSRKREVKLCYRSFVGCIVRLFLHSKAPNRSAMPLHQALSVHLCINAFVVHIHPRFSFFPLFQALLSLSLSLSLYLSITVSDTSYVTTSLLFRAFSCFSYCHSLASLFFPSIPLSSLPVFSSFRLLTRKATEKGVIKEEGRRREWKLQTRTPIFPLHPLPYPYR